MEPVAAIKSATLNSAREAGLQNLGAVAPGYAADMLLVDDLRELTPSHVFYAGKLVAQEGRLLGIVHHFVVAPCGICQREYYRSLGTEYAMGLLCCPHDTQGRESLGERRHIPDP